MMPTDIGIGVREALRDGTRATVIATLDNATYLRCGAAVVALTTLAAPAGPIHVRCPRLPESEVNDEVEIRGSAMIAPGWRVDLNAPAWTAALPAPHDLLAGAHVALTALAPVRPAALLIGDVPTAWPDHAATLAAGDLGAAARILSGRGRGLTPAGDDVLAGLLIVAAALRLPADHVVGAARTNDIAASYLWWAARGHSIEPVHRLLDAAARSDPSAARSAVRRLLSVGASSGADLAYGLVLGLRHLQPHPPVLRPGAMRSS